MENNLIRVFHNQLVGQSHIEFNLYNSSGVLMYKKGSKIDADFLIKGNYIAFYKKENDDDEAEEETVKEFKFEDDDISQFLQSVIELAIKKDADTIELKCSNDNIAILFFKNLLLIEKSEIDSSFYQEIFDKIKTIFEIKINHNKKEYKGSSNINILNKTINLDWHIIFNQFNKFNIIFEICCNPKNSIELKDFHLSKNNFEKLSQIANHQNGILIFTGPEITDKEKLISASINKFFNEDEIQIFDSIKNKSDLKNLNNIEKQFSEEKLNLIILKLSGAEKEEFYTKIIDLSSKCLIFVIITANEIHKSFKILLNTGLLAENTFENFRLFVFQKLINNLCPFCSEKYVVSDSILNKIFDHEISSQIYFSEPAGCEICFNTGFCGKLALQEILSPEDMDYFDFIKFTDEKKYSKFTMAEKYDDINYDCLKKVLKSLATIEDFYSITGIE